MSRKIFVNVAVADLNRSRAFFGSLGFAFNDQFCDDTAICMVISEENYVMLLTHDKFRQFTPPGRDICDTAKHNEMLLCLSCDSRQEVDDLVTKAVQAGGTNFGEPQDYGFMYGRSIQDLDGHVWELMFMDMSAVPASPAEHSTAKV